MSAATGDASRSRQESIPFVDWNITPTVVGKLVDIRKGRKFRERQTFVAEIHTSRGPVSLVLTSVLEKKLRERRVRRGDRVKIEFLGERQSERGWVYRDFRVRVVRTSR
jgi:hypothetical protein